MCIVMYTVFDTSLRGPFSLWSDDFLDISKPISDLCHDQAYVG